MTTTLPPETTTTTATTAPAPERASRHANPGPNPAPSASPAAALELSTLNSQLQTPGAPPPAATASWRFAPAAIRAGTAYQPPEARDALLWAYTWCTDPAHPVEFADFCARVGYNPNTVYKICTGRYKHPETGLPMDAPDKLVRAIHALRRLELARAKLGAKRFVPTRTADRVAWALEQARKSGRPVLLFGGSQIGKTEACAHYAAEPGHGRTLLVEVEAVAGLRGLLQAIAAKLGLATAASTADLIARLKNALGPDTVLILDEVHLLANVYRKGSFFACMEQIRRLWDARRFGLVLTFTELGYDLVARERQRELMQLFRRGVLRVNLGPRPHADDVRAILEAYGFDWERRHETIAAAPGLADTPWQVLKRLAAEEGLTALVERVRIAHEIAAGARPPREQPGWGDFLVAHHAIAQQAQVPDAGWENAA